MVPEPEPERTEPGRPLPKRQIFRDEALQRRMRAREFGDVLRLPPSWTRLTYPLVVLAALAGLAFLGSARVQEYARGPAAIRADGERFTVVALLPASYLAELRPGQRLVVGIEALPQARLDLRIDRVEGRPIGRAAAREALGEAGEGAEIPSSAIRVEASLPGSTIAFAGGRSPLHDGIPAEAEVPVRSERLCFALFPGLKAALRD